MVARSGLAGARRVVALAVVPWLLLQWVPVK